MKAVTCEHNITPKRNCKLCAAAMVRSNYAKSYSPAKRADRFIARKDESIIWQANRRAIILGRPGTITVDYWRSIKNKCYYCKTTQFPIQLDHTIPISKGGASTNDNTRAVCVFCNRAKGNESEAHFLTWLNSLK